MKKALAITGSYRGTTGHDNHVRSIVRALHNRGIEIELHDLPGWSSAKLPAQLEDPWFASLQRSVDATTHLFFCMPHQVVPVNSQRTINYTMFEADRIPPLWVERSKSYDLTIVPVSFCRDTWISSGVPEEKIRICPLGVDSHRFKPGLRSIKLTTADGKGAADYRNRFLNVADVNERKNLIGLLRAWLITTKTSDDAALLLKSGFYSPAAYQWISKEIAALEQSVGKTLTQAAQIFWINGKLGEDVVPSLYASATHYISTSFAEGFDLPMVEAAASGLQLIAPRHTAYTDYLNDEIAYFIPVTKVAAEFASDVALNKLFMGANWWQPDQAEICSTISGIISNTLLPKLSAREAVSRLNWQSTAELLDRIIFN